MPNLIITMPDGSRWSVNADTVAGMINKENGWFPENYVRGIVHVLATKHLNWQQIEPHATRLEPVEPDTEALWRAAKVEVEE